MFVYMMRLCCTRTSSLLQILKCTQNEVLCTCYICLQIMRYQITYITFKEKTQLKIAAPSPFNSMIHMHNTNPCVTGQWCLLLQLFQDWQRYSQQTMTVQIQKKSGHTVSKIIVSVFYHGLFLLEFWKPCTPETEIQNHRVPLFAGRYRLYYPPGRLDWHFHWA